MVRKNLAVMMIAVATLFVSGLTQETQALEPVMGTETVKTMHKVEELVRVADNVVRPVDARLGTDLEIEGHQAEIPGLPRTQHQPVGSQSDLGSVMINGRVCNRDGWHLSDLCLATARATPALSAALVDCRAPDGRSLATGTYPFAEPLAPEGRPASQAGPRCSNSAGICS